MKMYIFDEVLSDYTNGMVMIAADSLEQAQYIAFQEFNGMEKEFQDFLKEGWDQVAGIYALAGKVEAGIKHYVYGGS